VIPRSFVSTRQTSRAAFRAWSRYCKINAFLRHVPIPSRSSTVVAVHQSSLKDHRMVCRRTEEAKHSYGSGPTIAWS
jgi:hypothetical protein